MGFKGTILHCKYTNYVLYNCRPRLDIQICVFFKIFGALVAAMNDLAFNLLGYTYILLNDFFTAGMGVVTKKKLDTNALGSLENKHKK